MDKSFGDKYNNKLGGSDRSFGFVFSILFALIGLFPLLERKTPYWSLLLLSITLLIISIIIPFILSPLNRIWIKFGLLLQKIISPLILAIIYFAIITPIGIIMRLSGNDPMSRKMDTNTKSYWMKTNVKNYDSESMRKQF